MIKLTNLTAQTVQPGQSVTFSTIVKRSGCAECFRLGTGSVKLCKRPACYEAWSFIPYELERLVV